MQRRNTDQKRVVLQCIDCLGHATMEQVIENVHDVDSSISKSTIYRNVNVLLTENVIKKHYHFMCKECGHITDLNAKELDERFGNLKEVEGNQIEEVEIYFSGICKDCLKKKNN